ncbi:hypothetical protein YC2023_071933 [Brassica napus]
MTSKFNFKLVPKIQVYQTISDPKSRVEIVCAEQDVGLYVCQVVMTLGNVLVCIDCTVSDKLVAESHFSKHEDMMVATDEHGDICTDRQSTDSLWLSKISQGKDQRDDIGEEEIIVKERCLFIYTKKKLGLHIKMGLVYCLMGYIGGCKSTPTLFALLITSQEWLERLILAGQMNIRRMSGD